MNKIRRPAGRPVTASKPGQKATLGIRATATLKDRLAVAAKRNDRSLSQEAELRLEASFQRRDAALAIDFALEQLRSMLMMRLDGALLRTGLDSTTDADFVREAIVSVCAYMQIPPPPTADYLR